MDEQPRDEDGRYATSGTTVPGSGGSDHSAKTNVVEIERHDISGQASAAPSYPSHWSADIVAAVEQGKVTMRGAERVAESRRLAGR